MSTTARPAIDRDIRQVLRARPRLPKGMRQTVKRMEWVVPRSLVRDPQQRV